MVTLSALLLAVLFGGCASGTLPTYRYQTTAKVVELYLDWYPELYKTGGAIRLVIDGRKDPVLVVRLSIASFAAIDAVCPDDGCAIEKKENELRCSCDGRRYSPDGTVPAGGAGRPLDTFPANYKGGIVRIMLP